VSVREDPDLDLESYLREKKRRVDETLDRLLPEPKGPARTIVEAMRYAVTAGGKRLRPILALASAEACGGELEDVIEPAAALEMLHTYSLIHDDLPAMDDDDLRRGRPTVHRAFGEAEAILAGDALHTLAFEVIAGRPPGERHAARRNDAVRVLATSAGIAGMVGGQMADLEAERAPVDAAGLEWIHRHKTGALLAASTEIGAILAGADGTARSAMARYGATLGLAFQIADDILDCTATAEDLGKTPGKDEVAGKATYPALFGLEASRKRADALVDEALETLRPHRLLSPPLESLARFAVHRKK
jgi:geranylgeranyl diphosphate synthase type II